MLFSARRLWYYITLSPHHFQRLLFLPVELNSMLRTFRAYFWTCLTLLLWSHNHSHTHLFGFSNQGAFLIYLLWLPTSEHLSVCCYLCFPFVWHFEPLSHFPSQSHLCSFSHPPSCWAGNVATLPFHLLGMMLTETMSYTGTELLVGFSWLLFPIWFHKIWWLFWLTQTAQRPLALLAWVSSDIWAWCPSLGALSQNSCCTVLSYTSQGDFSPQDPSARVAFHLLSALTGTCWVECLRRVTGCLCLQVQAVI